MGIINLLENIRIWEEVLQATRAMATLVSRWETSADTLTSLTLPEPSRLDQLTVIRHLRPVEHQFKLESVPCKTCLWSMSLKPFLQVSLKSTSTSTPRTFSFPWLSC